MKKDGITIIKNPEHAQYLVLKRNEHDFKTMLMKNQTLFVDSKLQPMMQHFPNYLLGNLIYSDSNNFETIQSVISYRKGIVRKPMPLSSVEARLDIWLNSLF